MLVLMTAIGFNVETVQYNNIKFQVWDLGSWYLYASFFWFCARLYWFRALFCDSCDLRLPVHRSFSS
jgi:hypothetical protein